MAKKNEITEIIEGKEVNSISENTVKNGTPKTYFEEREKRHMNEKKGIAEFIVENYLQEGDSILIDAGTSLYPVADEILMKANSTPWKTHFTIMTHNYKAFQILVQAPVNSNLNVVLAGGRYDKDLNALFGPQTIMAYQEFFPRVVLIGVSGIVADIGLFCHGNTEEFAVKKEIYNKHCRMRIILADYTKMGVPDSLCFGRFGKSFEDKTQLILVTNKPDEKEDTTIKERYHNEIEKLRKKMVDIQIV
jgi:DeoR/GlpR family transcriptional regulator of sugar metabolism